MPTKAKEEAVATLKKKLESAQSVILADFTGLDVAKLSALRREFLKNDSEFYIVKNTLGRIAVREVGMEGLVPYLEGPTGWAITSEADPVTPAKILMEFARTHELPKVKGGYLDGSALSREQVVRVAMLPAKPVLIAQILGLIQAPVQGVAGAVHAVMTSLAVAVDEVRKQKEAGGGAKEEPPAAADE